MQKVSEILGHIEHEIENSTERAYFWTHEVRYHFILSQIQQIAENKKLTILDIGCFPYHIGKALEIMGHQVYGVASEHEPVKKKNISVVNIEKDSFPYEDNFFDLVLCNEVVEHLPNSPVFALKQILKIVKKKGLLMITTPNLARSINRAKLLLGKSVMYPIDVYFEENGKGNNIYHRHNREYILQELLTLLQKTDWNTIKKGYFISYTTKRKRVKKDTWWLHLGKSANVALMELVPSLQDTLYTLSTKA